MYQIIKKRGEHGRPAVLKTYPTEESARQYLSSMNDEIFQKCIHARTAIPHWEFLGNSPDLLHTLFAVGVAIY